jgi:pimeloyl-ACP methyl ester carboxylesterase
MTMRTEDVFFNNTRGARLSGKIYSGAAASEKGVVFCHGLFSTKDGYKITRMAESLVKAGFDVLAFDFTYAGESEGSIEDISLFQSVKDIGSAVHFLTMRGVSEIHIIGSSMGAAAGILYCAWSRPGPASFISIAAPIDLKALLSGNSAAPDPNNLPEDGFSMLEGFKIKNSFFREIASIDMKEFARTVPCRVFIIHGKLDSIVPFSNALDFAGALTVPYRSLYIEDGDHNLTRDQDIELLKSEISQWLTRG